MYICTIIVWHSTILKYNINSRLGYPVDGEIVCEHSGSEHRTHGPVAAAGAQADGGVVSIAACRRDVAVLDVGRPVRSGYHGEDRKNK